MATRKIGPFALAALLVGGTLDYEITAYHYAEQVALASANAVIQVRFSPGRQCTRFVKEAISEAEKPLLVQACTFASWSIAEAPIQAH